MKKILTMGAFVLGASAFSMANAGTIQGAQSVVNSVSQYSSTVPIENTINQTGLSANYVNGVTDFDSFVSTTTHTIVADGFEWFAADGTYSEVIDYDLGVLFNVDKIAIWNEESWGTDSVNIFASTDSTFTSSTSLGSFSLTDNPFEAPYLADVLTFSPVFAQFFRIEVFGSIGDAVSLGEVAFSTSTVSAVPIPAAAFLFAPALLGFMGLRRKAKITVA